MARSHHHLPKPPSFDVATPGRPAPGKSEVLWHPAELADDRVPGIWNFAVADLDRLGRVSVFGHRFGVFKEV